MSFYYSQILKSGLIVMAADKREATQGIERNTGQINYEYYRDIKKLYITKNNIGISYAGSKSKKGTPDHINKYISNIECKTPLETAQFLRTYTLSIDTDVEIVFSVTGFVDEKPMLYKASTKLPDYYTDEYIAEWKMTFVDRGILLISDQYSCDPLFDVGSAYPKTATDLIGYHGLAKMKHFNKKDAIQYILWLAGQCKNSCDNPDHISEEIDILLIYDDHYEWIGGIK